MRFNTAHTAVAALVLTASALANAAPIVVPTFSLDLMTDPGIPSASVVSTNATETVLSLDAAAEWLHAIGGGSMPHSQHAAYDGILSAAEGYRITGMRFTASITGSFEVGQPPPGTINVDYGDAGNFFWIVYDDVTAPGDFLSYKETHITDQAVEVTLPIFGNGTAVPVSFELTAGAYGYATYFDFPNPNPDLPFDPGTWDKVYGFGQIDVWNPQLTIYTEALPVPEPSTYLMLAAGMAVLGAGRYRARRRA